MAWHTVNLIKLERTAARLREYADRLSAVIEVAKKANMSEVVLQWRQVDDGIQRVMNGVTTAELHIPDQIDCLDSGDTPMWQRNVTRAAVNKANREAAERRERMEAEGLIKTPEAAPARKKKPKG